MRNKPNFGRCDVREPHDSRIPAFQSSGVGRGAIVRNEPNFRAKPGGARPEGRGATVPRHPSLEPIMRNEPNFPAMPGGWGPVDCAKRTQLGRSARPPESEMCKTNPICPTLSRRGRADRAKQSQFAKPIVQNEPNLAQRCRAGRGPGDAGRGAIVRNKPNLGGVSSGKCPASSSRSLPRCPIIPIFHYSTIPIRCRLRETNPICVLAQNPPCPV